jgi:hypothetical protein
MLVREPSELLLVLAPERGSHLRKDRRKCLNQSDAEIKAVPETLMTSGHQRCLAKQFSWSVHRPVETLRAHQGPAGMIGDEF